MHVTPTGQNLYHEGKQIGRYGRDIGADEVYFCWYHSGLRGNDQPTWAMETGVEWNISVSVDTILVVDNEAGLFAIDRSGMTHEDRKITISGSEQYLVQASDHCVKSLPHEPTDVLQGKLWLESGNEINENYHQKGNEA